MKRRTLALAAVLTLAPATAHATYTDPEQVGHGSGSFAVCTTPTSPGPWVYVIAARDPRIIRAPEDSWLFGRMDGSRIRRVVTDGRVRVITDVPLSGAVGDSIKVRAPGTDDTTDLRLIAVKAPSCATPSQTPTETPTWTPSPTSSPTASHSASSPGNSPTPSAPVTTPASWPSATNSPSGACSTSDAATSDADCSAELAHTGGGLTPLIGTALAAILVGWVLAWPRRTRRH